MCTVTGSEVHIEQPTKSLWRRIAAPVVVRIRTIFLIGLTPQKLALTLCIGCALGIMPLLWGTSLICILLAHLFRLNHVALQSVNYLFYPVQLALLLPFFKLGTWLFPWGPPLPERLFSALLHNPGLLSVNFLAWITLKSIAAWLVTVLPAALLIYGILLAIASGKTERTAASP
jgi:uncharacterized protein (DUF2062 family)